MFYGDNMLELRIDYILQRSNRSQSQQHTLIISQLMKNCFMKIFMLILVRLIWHIFIVIHAKSTKN